MGKRTSVLFGLLTAGLLAVSLTACSEVVDIPADAGSIAPTSSSTPVELPVASAAPALTLADAGTCTGALTETKAAALTSTGYALSTGPVEGASLLQEVASKGFACEWVQADTSLRIAYGQAPFAPSEWAQQEEELRAFGWTRIDYPVAGVLQAPIGDSVSEVPAVLYQDGLVHYTTSAPLLGALAQ